MLRAVSSESAESPDLVRLRPGGRRRRFGLAAVGGLFVLVTALLAAAYMSSLRSSERVIVLSADVVVGEVLTADHLVVVEMGTDGLGQLGYVSADRQGDVVGLSALGALPAGSLVAPGMFGDRSSLVPDGFSVVGAVLDRGALPAGVVHVGDEVDLLAVADSAVLTSGADSRPSAVVLGRAQVWALEAAPELERGTSLSLAVDAELAPAVAQAAADGRLRVGLVGQ